MMSGVLRSLEIYFLSVLFRCLLFFLSHIRYVIYFVSISSVAVQDWFSFGSISIFAFSSLWRLAQSIVQADVLLR